LLDGDPLEKSTDPITEIQHGVHRYINEKPSQSSRWQAA
jgi:hypothetical protein